MSRLNNLGEPTMPLTETYPYGVAFVGRWLSEGLADDVDGTAFLVALPAEAGDPHAYIVTANHVVEGVRNSFVRLDVLPEGEVENVKIKKWYENPHGHDVAVAPIELPENHNMTATGIDQFVDDPALDHDEYYRQPVSLELGATVFFIGLFKGIHAMAEGNVPMVRSGTLGRLWQERCPVKRSEKAPLEYITAHLIDCRSFSGFSGSPCYLHESRGAYFDSNHAVGTKERTSLLGLIAGHFDDVAAVYHSSGKTDHLHTEVNTGIGYVIPAEYIRATLMREDLVEKRKEREQKAQSQERGATQDASRSEPGDEFESFEALTRQLVRTPKPAKKDAGKK